MIDSQMVRYSGPVFRVARSGGRVDRWDYRLQFRAPVAVRVLGGRWASTSYLRLYRRMWRLWYARARFGVGPRRGSFSRRWLPDRFA